jgi:hypothetical protein
MLFSSVFARPSRHENPAPKLLGSIPGPELGVLGLEVSSFRHSLLVRGPGSSRTTPHSPYLLIRIIANLTEPLQPSPFASIASATAHTHSHPQPLYFHGHPSQLLSHPGGYPQKRSPGETFSSPVRAAAGPLLSAIRDASIPIVTSLLPYLIASCLPYPVLVHPLYQSIDSFCTRSPIVPLPPYRIHFAFDQEATP